MVFDKKWHGLPTKWTFWIFFKSCNEIEGHETVKWMLCFKSYWFDCLICLRWYLKKSFLDFVYQLKLCNTFLLLFSAGSGTGSGGSGKHLLTAYSWLEILKTIQYTYYQEPIW